jgi:hypothetical protein
MKRNLTQELFGKVEYLEHDINPNYPNKDTYVCEDGYWILQKNSRDVIVISYVKLGDEKAVRKLLEEGLCLEATLKSLEMAVELDKWNVVDAIMDFSKSTSEQLHTECLKRMFLKFAFLCDVEKVKYYLEKLIENVTGELTDDTGKRTLEIAMENPTDIITILQNYGFHQNSIEYAFRCLNGK